MVDMFKMLGKTFFVVQPGWRYLPLHRLFISNTCKFQVEAIIWKAISFECEAFFPSPESLLPWQQQKILSKGGWASESVSWACRGMAVLNKKALSLTVSRGVLLLLLLLPSHWSPYPLPSPPPRLSSLLCLHLVSGFYFAGLLFSWYPPIPAIEQNHLFHSCYLDVLLLLLLSLILFLAFAFISSHCHLLRWCFILLECVRS